MAQLEVDSATVMVNARIHNIRAGIEALEDKMLTVLPQRSEQRRKLFDILVSLERLEDELTRLAKLDSGMVAVTSCPDCSAVGYGQIVECEAHRREAQPENPIAWVKDFLPGYEKHGGIRH